MGHVPCCSEGTAQLFAHCVRKGVPAGVRVDGWSPAAPCAKGCVKLPATRPKVDTAWPAGQVTSLSSDDPGHVFSGLMPRRMRNSSFLNAPDANRPLFDRRSRSFRAGVTPEYVWIRDESAPCEEELGPPLKHVKSALAAARHCDKNPSCGFFNYVPSERTALLCKGNGFMRTRPSAHTDVGIKPRAVSVEGMAVMTNQQAICPDARLLEERDDVRSTQEAQRLCDQNSDCSHWTFILRRFSQAPRGFKPRLQLCAGALSALPEEGSITAVRAA